MNASERREYWRGYHAMKRRAYDYCNAEKAFSHIYQSNASDTFVKGARRAYKYIMRVGVQNITA